MGVEHGIPDCQLTTSHEVLLPSWIVSTSCQPERELEDEFGLDGLVLDDAVPDAPAAEVPAIHSHAKFFMQHAIPIAGCSTLSII